MMRKPQGGTVDPKTASDVHHNYTWLISQLPVTIESDSHGRDSAGLVRRLLGTRRRVGGVCRPGAGLLAVIVRLATFNMIVATLPHRQAASGSPSPSPHVE
ncbi:hypothetical protein J6590_097496 [Homalodisca vitripennis]|nr:hypothetical protein J6590_097496 [Homalodisca vitripennis]